ncbi:hypothetical protein MAR_012368 [Mya arenaria]|uniref:Uncharacterized protein n=1 Tax=Mya arenaria TaxID=6604 RepID=A0ABY7FZT1_MYAAR|nr:hypothetical protein MAR_012368 [Mya arenaria]
MSIANDGYSINEAERIFSSVICESSLNLAWNAKLIENNFSDISNNKYSFTLSDKKLCLHIKDIRYQI